MIAHLLERYFYWHGGFVARYPYHVIVAVVACVTFASTGMVNIFWEFDLVTLWIRPNSEFAHNYHQLLATHPLRIRQQNMIFTVEGGGDILQPTYLKQMLKMRKKVHEEAVSTDGSKWADHCVRVPRADMSAIASSLAGGDSEAGLLSGLENFLKPGFLDKLDPSLQFYPEPYCRTLKSLDEICLEFSILELWTENGRIDEAAVESATKDEILEKINGPNKSGLFSVERDFKGLLGGVKLDEAGRVVSAEAALYQFSGEMNVAQARIEAERPQSMDPAQSAQLVDLATLDMEAALTEIVTNKSWFKDGFECSPAVFRGYWDASYALLMADVPLAFLGFAIVYVYVTVMLGKFDLIESRVYLALAGVSSVGLSILCAYSFCCTLGLPLTSLHPFMPFLILGLGVDDMFVIVQAFNNFCDATASKKPLMAIEEKFAQAMRASGVAITVTSVTDFAAFAIGAVGSVPAMFSFCMFCATGVVVVYFLQTSWFLAWMVLDQRRVEARRNGLLPCLKHKKSENRSGGFEMESVLKDGFQSLGRILMLRPVKVLVILVAMGLFSVSIRGTASLVQGFVPDDYISPDSPFAQFLQKNREHFSTEKERVHVFFANLDLPEDFHRVHDVVQGLKNQTDIVLNVDSFTDAFKEYYDDNFKAKYGVEIFDLSKEYFRSLLTRFLFSPPGTEYMVKFNYVSDLVCGQPAPDIEMFFIEYNHHQYRDLEDSKEKIEGMDRCKEIIAASRLNGEGDKMAFAYSYNYIGYETDKVIKVQLYQNIALAFVCISATTALLMSNLYASVQVLCCVIMTMVNVMGFMHFLGLKIEILTCVDLIICIGMSVDYAAHIANTYLQATGSREDKCLKSLSEIGPAVFNGAFSTFLSVVLLSDSRGHILLTSFKIFSMVVWFAFFNSVFVLPVTLSLFGPTKQPEAAMPPPHKTRD